MDESGSERRARAAEAVRRAEALAVAATRQLAASNEAARRAATVAVEAHAVLAQAHQTLALLEAAIRDAGGTPDVGP